MMSGEEYHKKYYELKIKEKRACNTVLLNIHREYKKEVLAKYPYRMQCLDDFIKNLNFFHNLESHRGCVNCIEFSEDGRYIISGSDDTKIILWDVNILKNKKTFNTGHRGNIFTVKFLPKTADHYVVSGAGDSRIEVRNIILDETMSVCQCHTERVKRIATLPLSSDVYFSASEDGTIRQFDRREKHYCSAEANNVLVDLRHLSDVKLEAKCLAVNPIQSELIAVGTTDAYIRVFDRRKLTLTSTKALSSTTQFNPLPASCVQYYVPGHLPDKMIEYNNKLFKSLATTYITYSSDGRKLLANIGGDNIYVFDTFHSEALKKLVPPPKIHPEKENVASSGIYINSRAFHYQFNGCKEKLPFESLEYLFDDEHNSNLYPSEVKNLIIEAESLARPDDLTALELFNKAIYLWPYSAHLYSSRADVFMRRDWDGDLYSALRDCDKALELDPSYKKAFFKKIACLHYMQKDQEALNVMAKDRDIMALIEANELHIIAIREFLEKSRDTKMEKNDWNFMKRSRNELLSEDEEVYRSFAKDYISKYTGHCNTTTDIKEAIFIGRDCEYIAAGSDDGNVFIWDGKTSNLVNVFKADQSIVNCVQFHPRICMMATSGIESVIKLWTPNKLRAEPHEPTNNILRDNQVRMNQDPMEVVMLPTIEDLNFSTHYMPVSENVRDYSTAPDDDDNTPTEHDGNTSGTHVHSDSSCTQS